MKTNVVCLKFVLIHVTEMTINVLSIVKRAKKWIQYNYLSKQFLGKKRFKSSVVISARAHHLEPKTLRDFFPPSPESSLLKTQVDKSIATGD